MATLIQPLNDNVLAKRKLTEVKDDYKKLRTDYLKLVDNNVIICPFCGEAQTTKAYYRDDSYAIGVFPECKRCIQREVEQRVNDTDQPNETVESAQRMLQRMNLPYIDSLYKSLKNDLANGVRERDSVYIFGAYLTPIKSLPQYKGKTWKNSEFGTEDNAQHIQVEHPRPESYDFFGRNYTEDEILFLQKQYDDWLARYSCETKAQEVLFLQICYKQLEINKLQKAGRDTSKAVKDLQDLMGSLNVKPSQSNSDALTEALTFGQLIAKWEEEDPIPEPEEDFKDVDHIGKYIDVFFKGHLSKMMGLKNGFSSLYDKFMSKYTVKRQTIEDEAESEALFEHIFGKVKDGDSDG